MIATFVFKMDMKIRTAIICVLYISSTLARITEIPLPADIHRCFERELTQSNINQTVGEMVFSRCVHRVLWQQQTAKMPAPSLGADALKWINGLVNMNSLLNIDSLSGVHDIHNPSNKRPRRQTERRTPDARQPEVGDRRIHDFSDRRPQDFRQTDTAGRPIDLSMPDMGARVLDLRQPEVGDRRATDFRPQDIGGQVPERQLQRGRQPRIRKEYRMLSDRERYLFHRAINMLKADTSVAPNKYDALGRLHFMSVGRAHFGPNFLPWHRLFLVVMENALREKIPTVTIPYWDSTLDDALLDPRSSIIWTPDFLGEANGYVENGPFANWDTPTGRLIRYFGTGGTMMNWTYIHKSFRQNHLEDITDPYAKPDNNIEHHHNQVHTWVGGHMAPPALAAFDPLFYMLHSYVDLLWEIFRGLQKRRGIDPTMDYPRNITVIPDGQRYEDPSGFGSLLNRHGLSNVFTDNIYKYDRPPSCTQQNPDCGSRHIRCETTGGQAKCVSASIFDIKELLLPNGLPMAGGSGIREIRSPRTPEMTKRDRMFDMIQRVSNVQCRSDNVNERYVNNYDIDGVVDKQLWAYIPVQVIYKNQKVLGDQQLPANRGAVYDICKRNNGSSVSSRIFVESNGITYNGLFKEIYHFKDDVAISSSLGYIGVKRPTEALLSEVLVAAYDECGRMCQPYCLDSTRTRNRKCHGAMKVTNHAPLMYGDDVASATRAVWQSDQNGLPYIVENEIFLTMVCDTSQSFWPW